MIPTNPDGPTIDRVFRVVEFEFVTKILVAETALDTETLPSTVTFAPIPEAVFIPTEPVMLVRFIVVALDPDRYTDCHGIVVPMAPVWSVSGPKFEPKYAKAPWTVKFCLKIVLPVVRTSPKYVFTGISNKGKHCFPADPDGVLSYHLFMHN